MKQEAQIAKRENAGPLATNVFEADAGQGIANIKQEDLACLLYTSPSPRDRQKSRMPSSA